MAKIIRTSGDIIDIEPKNGKDFKLAELKEIVGGYIEVVYLSNGQLMVVNEQGKLLGLEPNFKASLLYGPYDVIVGDVLVCDSNQIE